MSNGALPFRVLERPTLFEPKYPLPGSESALTLLPLIAKSNATPAVPCVPVLPMALKKVPAWAPPIALKNTWLVSVPMFASSPC